MRPILQIFLQIFILLIITLCTINTFAQQKNDKNKPSLTILSPDEFQAATKQDSLKSLQDSATEYKNIRDQLSPSTKSTNSNTTTTPPPTTPVETTPEPSSTSNTTNTTNTSSEQNDNTSNYYFQPNKQNNSSGTNTQSGFSPYGTSNGENK